MRVNDWVSHGPQREVCGFPNFSKRTKNLTFKKFFDIIFIEKNKKEKVRRIQQFFMRNGKIYCLNNNIETVQIRR